MSHPDDEMTFEDVAPQLNVGPELRERIARHEAAVAQAVAAERAAGDADMAANLERLRRVAEREMLAAKGLPCFHAMARAEGADVEAAVEACNAAGARTSCERYAREQDAACSPSCARLIQRQRMFDFAAALYEARIPGAVDTDGQNRLARALRKGWRHTPREEEPPVAELLFATRTRYAGEVVFAGQPLDETEPLQVVRLFAARQRGRVRIGEGHVELFGHETVLFLGGSLDTGKTVAACSVALIREVLFVSAPELVGMDPAVAPARAMAAPFLVIDDLGTERNVGAGAAASTLAGILDARHLARRLTIVTTNMRTKRDKPDDPETLLERYGERLFHPERGRIREGMALVGFKGPGRRGRARQLASR